MTSFCVCTRKMRVRCTPLSVRCCHRGRSPRKSCRIWLSRSGRGSNLPGSSGLGHLALPGIWSGCICGGVHGTGMSLTISWCNGSQISPRRNRSRGLRSEGLWSAAFRSSLRRSGNSCWVRTPGARALTNWPSAVVKLRWRSTKSSTGFGRHCSSAFNAPYSGNKAYDS